MMSRGRMTFFFVVAASFVAIFVDQSSFLAEWVIDLWRDGRRAEREARRLTWLGHVGDGERRSGASAIARRPLHSRSAEANENG